MSVFYLCSSVNLRLLTQAIFYPPLSTTTKDNYQNFRDNCYNHKMKTKSVIIYLKKKVKRNKKESNGVNGAKQY